MTGHLKLSSYLNGNLWIETSRKFIEGPCVRYVEEVGAAVGQSVEELFMIDGHLKPKTFKVMVGFEKLCDFLILRWVCTIIITIF